MLNDILNAVLPHLLEIMAALLTTVLSAAALKAKAKWGIEIEAKHREALHSAIMSGIMAATAQKLTGGRVIDFALAHARSSSPDAITALQASQAVLQNLAEAKLKQLGLK